MAQIRRGHLHVTPGIAASRHRSLRSAWRPRQRFHVQMCDAAARHGRVESRHVDVDEPHVGILEGRLGSGGEVAPPGSDPDHHVGLTGEAVGGRGPGRADRAQAEWMLGDQGAAAGLGPAAGIPVASTSSRNATVASL